MRPCPLHPTETAFERCPRCERPACGYCLPGGARACVTCEGEGTLRPTIPWQAREGNLVLRFFRTIRAVMTRPGTALGGVTGESSVGRALGFAVGVYLLTGFVTLAVVLPPAVLRGMGERATLFEAGSGAFLFALVGGCAFPLVFAVSAPLSVLYFGSLYHYGLRLAGARPNMAASLSVAAYALSVSVLWVAAAPALLLPHAGTVVLAAGSLGQLLWMGTAFTSAAEMRHHLSGRKAAVAGWLAPLVTVLLMFLLMATWAMLTDAVTPSGAPDQYR